MKVERRNGESRRGKKRRKRTGDTLTGSNLELPLGGHDLGVNTGDLDSGVEASSL